MGVAEFLLGNDAKAGPAVRKEPKDALIVPFMGAMKEGVEGNGVGTAQVIVNPSEIEVTVGDPFAASSWAQQAMDLPTNRAGPGLGLNRAGMRNNHSHIFGRQKQKLEVVVPQKLNGRTTLCGCRIVNSVRTKMFSGSLIFFQMTSFVFERDEAAFLA